ncbi:hypothetical protein SAMN04487846_2263 [Microbacterium sp. cf046]|uniref:hypothetical protein n=1 Tax=Microbacterium sp. cf046 TaxID=1761803 RepID=UPI0008ED368F|nr:hypothetical protein [Microbacterium sp. cf046]SFS07635.1 hypothetical protein SAMN04487846_2263 [Microbacterium sp. cf046]
MMLSMSPETASLLLQVAATLFIAQIVAYVSLNWTSDRWLLAGSLTVSVLSFAVLAALSVTVIEEGGTDDAILAYLSFASFAVNAVILFYVQIFERPKTDGRLPQHVAVKRSD